MPDARHRVPFSAALCLAAALPAAAGELKGTERAQRSPLVVEARPSAPRLRASSSPEAGSLAEPVRQDLAAALGGSGSGKPAPVPPASDAQQYCTNIAAAAADARYAWQANKLAALETQIKQRISELENKRAEYRRWLDKREEALKAAERGLVNIYAKMRPEAASQQLSALDDATAAAVLARLTPRNAGAILNEMETRRAVRLANAIAGHPDAPEPGQRKP